MWKCFEEGFKQHFCPEVKKYYVANNLFLPPNTNSLLQPMDQGVIATFNKCYLRRNFNNLIDEIGNQSQTKEALDEV